mmetsp:Transcript_22450/g.45006  ORF Transcript_22450/g.45006 Transcript_22450/m.45006 type:complete len:354 (-) Transcript_22450:329-1390(-)
MGLLPSSKYIRDRPARYISVSPNNTPSNADGRSSGGLPPASSSQRTTAAARASRRARADASDGSSRYAKDSRSTDLRAAANGSSSANTHEEGGGAEDFARKESVACGTLEPLVPSTRNAAACLSSLVSVQNVPISKSSLSALFFWRLKMKNQIKSRAAITAPAPAPAATAFTAEAGAGIDVGSVIGIDDGGVVGIDDGGVVGIGDGGVVSVGASVGELVGHLLPFEPENISSVSFPLTSHARHLLKLDAPMNIYVISLVAATSQPDRSPLKEDAAQNIPLISRVAATSHPDRSPSKEDANMNIPYIDVDLPVSHWEILSLKSCAHINKLSNFFIPQVSHLLMYPYSASALSWS